MAVTEAVDVVVVVVAAVVLVAGVVVVVVVVMSAVPGVVGSVLMAGCNANSGTVCMFSIE